MRPFPNELIPLANFDRFGPQLWRSAQPEHAYAYEWLAEHGVHKIIDLRAENERKDHNLLHESGAANKIELVHIPIVDDTAPTLEQAERIRMETQEYLRKVLIHCKNGHGRTSTAHAIARLFRGPITLDDILETFQYRYGSTFLHPSQLEFLQEYERHLKAA